MFSFRRTTGAAVFALAWLLPLSPAQAQDFEELFQRGITWQKAGQPRQAAAAYEAALQVADGSEGNYEWTLANLGQVYSALAQYDRAEKMLKQVITRWEAEYGANNDDLEKVIGDLANTYASQNKFKEAAANYQRAIEIRSQYHAVEDFEVLIMLERMINIASQVEGAAKAAELAARLLKELETRVGPNDYRLRDPLQTIAIGKIAEGKFSAAEQIIHRFQRLPAGERWDDVNAANEALQVGGMYLDMGRWTEALSQYRIAERASRMQAERSPGLANLLNSIHECQAECLLGLGQPARAVQLLEIAVPKIEASHARGAAPGWYTLGKAYLRQGRTEQAEQVFRHLIDDKEFPEGNRIVAATQLGAILAARGQTAEAEKLLLAGLKYLRKNESASSYMAENCRLLGDFYLGSGNPAEAEKHYRAGIEVLDKIEGRYSTEQAAGWLGVARALERQDKATEALAAADKARRVLHELTVSILPALPESEQLAFLAEEEPSLQGALALVRGHSNQQAIEQAATWLLNRKGLAQQAVAQRILLAREASDPALVALVDDWLAVRHRLTKIAVREGLQAANQSTTAEMIERERDLARQVGEAKVPKTTAEPWYELAQLRQALPASAVYVDLVRYVPPGKARPVTYLAWIVPPAGHGRVRLIDLGSADELDHCVTMVRHELTRVPDAMRGLAIGDAEEQPTDDALQRSLTQLSERLLAPLMPTLTKFEHWVICPEGPLWLIPLSALLLPSEQGAKTAYVVEKHRVSLVVSGRDLVRKPELVSGNPALVMAAADFGAMSPDAVAKQPSTSAPGANSPAIDLVASRGVVRGALGRSAMWSPLPGTADEAHSVEPALTSYLKQPPQMLLGLQASETMLKRAWRPRIALVSTHGYLIEPGPNETGLGNPLLRCGLVLAGANQSHQADDTEDDGIFTGLDVLSLDLRGTELVVLSACETGLGQISASEGVAGLRQAFQLAGAQSVVATLWRIPDKETAQLMSSVFQRLAAGADKATALAEGQRDLLNARRSAGRSLHPYYWAAFTLTGSWRPPEVGPETARPPRPAVGERIEVIVEQARVMDGAAILSLVQYGDRLVRGQSNGQWIQVFYKPGTQQSGWILASEVRPVK